MFERLNFQEGPCHLNLDSWLFMNILSVQVDDKLNMVADAKVEV
jgi:hypothetical protein